MSSFKPAYLIHGDDHGRLAERRARLRAVAERESGAGGLQVLEGDAATPDAAAAALAAMMLTPGRRFIVVDGVERWKDGDLEPLEQALAAAPPDTTIAFFAREDTRATAPARLVAAVTKAGGDVAAERNVKPWELPKWVAARARELELELDPGAAGASRPTSSSASVQARCSAERAVRRSTASASSRAPAPSSSRSFSSSRSRRC